MKPPREAALPPVPIQESVADFYSTLFGIGCAASKVTPSDVGADSRHVVGVYRDDLGRIAALVTGDSAFVTASGAALAMIPASAARDALAGGTIDQNLLENFREVCNITASMLNTATTPHLTLVDVWPTDHADLPNEVWDVLASPRKRREFAVTIAGYHDGRLGIVIH